jgi:hypothetical protein
VEGEAGKVFDSLTLAMLIIQLAMYPVMFPIYIAEFEHKTEARTWKYQVIMDAHDSTVRDFGLPRP